MTTAKDVVTGRYATHTPAETQDSTARCLGTKNVVHFVPRHIGSSCHRGHARAAPRHAGAASICAVMLVKCDESTARDESMRCPMPPMPSRASLHRLGRLPVHPPRRLRFRFDECAARLGTKEAMVRAGTYEGSARRPGVHGSRRDPLRANDRTRTCACACACTCTCACVCDKASGSRAQQ